MAWEENLFEVLEDLEQQAEGLYDVERGAEIADRSRSEYQQVSLASRLTASIDRELSLDVLGVGTIHGTLERVAGGWCLVRGPAQDWLVNLAAVTGIRGASERSVPEVAWPVVARLGLGSALRRLAEAGERCVLHLVDGSRHEGAPTRVGADFVEVPVAQGRVVLIAFTALAAVQSRD